MKIGLMGGTALGGSKLVSELLCYCPELPRHRGRIRLTGQGVIAALERPVAVDVSHTFLGTLMGTLGSVGVSNGSALAWAVQGGGTGAAETVVATDGRA
jgi:hypothetical protein